MDTGRSQQRKRGKGDGAQSTGNAPDAFDQLGNDGVKAHVDAARSSQQAGDQQTGTSPLESAAASEAVGSSTASKRAALGSTGLRALSAAIGQASARFGTRPLDPAARAMVEDRVLRAVTTQDIVRAQEDGQLEALVCGALRTSALDARDEVVFTLQQLMQDDGVMARMLRDGSPATVATDLLEFLAVELVDPADVFTLAAYDHDDILRRLVVGDDAMQVVRRLSPLAMRFGGFAPVLFQMVLDALAQKPLPMDVDPQGRPDPKLMAPAFRKTLLDIVTDFRSFRTMSA